MGNSQSVDCSDVIEEQYIVTRVARDVFRRSLKAYKKLCREKDILLANISRELADKECENRSLRAEIHEVKRALTTAEHANFKILYRDGLREVAKYKSMVADTQRERDDFARRLGATTKDADSLRAKITEHNASVSRMQTRIAALEAQNSPSAGEFPQHLNDETERSRQATVAREELQRKLARASADRVIAFGHLKEKDIQIASLEQENSDLKAEVQLVKSRHEDAEKDLTGVKLQVPTPREQQEQIDLIQITAEVEARFAEREKSAEATMAAEFEALFQERIAHIQAELRAEADKNAAAMQSESAAKDESHEVTMRAVQEQSAHVQASNEKLTDELRRCKLDLADEVTRRQTTDCECDRLAKLEIELHNVQSELGESKEIAKRAKAQAESLTAEVRDSQSAAESTAKQMEATKSHLLEREKITELARQENQALRSQLDETEAALEALRQESKKDSPLMPSIQDLAINFEAPREPFHDGSHAEIKAHIMSREHAPEPLQEMEVTESPANAFPEGQPIDLDADGSEELEFEDVDMSQSSVRQLGVQPGETESFMNVGQFNAPALPTRLEEQTIVDLDMENSNLDMENSNEVAGVLPASFPHEQSNFEFAKNFNTLNFLNIDFNRSEPAVSVNPLLHLPWVTHNATVQEPTEPDMPPIEEFDFDDFLWGERSYNETKTEDAATEVATEVGTEWDLGEAAAPLGELANDRESKKRRVQDASVKTGSPQETGEEEAKFAEHDAAGSVSPRTGAHEVPAEVFGTSRDHTTFGQADLNDAEANSTATRSASFVDATPQSFRSWGKRPVEQTGGSKRTADSDYLDGPSSAMNVADTLPEKPVLETCEDVLASASGFDLNEDGSDPLDSFELYDGRCEAWECLYCTGFVDDFNIREHRPECMEVRECKYCKRLPWFGDCLPDCPAYMKFCKTCMQPARIGCASTCKRPHAALKRAKKTFPESPFK